MGQPQPRALSLLGDPIISPMSGCGSEQQSDTAILWAIKAQKFCFGLISLSPDADAVVALQTKSCLFVFTTDSISTSMQWKLLRRSHLSLMSGVQPPWTVLAVHLNKAAKVMLRFILQSANKNKRFIKRQVPPENLFT